ncbi:MAG: MMPL family transporter [Anaerolineae bacterium]|nr:MMPL family transporter [Anaerolineae bacterium]
MFFARIGRFATRYRLLIIAAWLFAAAVITLIAPNIEDVASSDQADFLPDDAPFAHAEAVYQSTFPDGFSPSSTVIVIDAHAAGGVLDREAETFEEQVDTTAGRLIRDFQAWLASDDAPDNISGVSAPIASPAAATLMIAPDNQVAIVDVSLGTSSTDEATGETLTLIDDWLVEHRPDTIKTYQTGQAPIVNNTTDSIKTSVDRTIWVTVVLVIVMLLLVYRSPVSPLVPLLAVTVAYLITRGMVAYLGAHYMTITSYANVLLVTVMYGAGTDYCLFLISRFREEMADHVGLEKATSRTVHLVGETITSSAGTVFVGFMAMIFAEMGIFNTSGPALALGVVMSLAAGLTFVPALLAVFGERAFWPGQATHRSAGRLYAITSKQVSSRPLVTIVIIVTLMAPLSVYGVNQRISYDLMGDLPDGKDSVIGYDLMAQGLGAGNVLPMDVIITGRDPDHIAADIARLTDDIAAVDGVADVRGLNTLLGQNRDMAGLLRVDVQLGLALDMLAGLSADTLADPQQLEGLIGGVTSYLDLLVERFPQIANDPDLLTLQEILGGNLLQMASRQADIAPALAGLAARFNPDASDPIPDPYLMLTGLGDILAAVPASDANTGFDRLAQQVPAYLTADSTAFKLSVILGVQPTSYEAMHAVHAIRDILTGYQDTGEAVLSGGSATNADIRDTMDRDFLRAFGFVLLGIFFVLLLMLRSMVAPLYLIATVLLSFTCTLGLTNFVFKEIVFKVDGLTWYVPFFMFVFLVALGMDYSIFLFGRIKEEVAHHGIREGVHVAVARTGAIITSAGAILAGTFAAMSVGEIKGLAEIGFAVAVGVLIDTFVVRTVLDPALAALFGKWTWWPGGVPKPHSSRHAEAAPAADATD